MTESVLNEFDSPLVASNTTATLAPQPVASEQTELDKVEAAALNVVHQIEEKMEIVSDVAIEGIQVAKAVNPIHVHIAVGGGSIIRNPG